jgi:hypothetical protein
MAPEMLASGTFSLSSLAIDGEVIYFTDSGTFTDVGQEFATSNNDGAVYRLTTGGSPVKLVGDLAAPSSLTLTSAQMFVTTWDNQVLSIDRPGVAVNVVYHETPVALASDGAKLFAATLDAIVSIDASGATSLASSTSTNALLVANDSVYWAGDTIQHIPTRGGPAQTLVPAEAYVMAACDNTLYFQGTGSPVRSTSMSAYFPTDIDPSVEVRTMVADRGALYATTAEQELVRWSGTPRPSTIASTDRTFGPIAVDDNYLYWTVVSGNYSEIWRALK